MFSGTNLLTSCNSARCLFSAVFGFRKFSKEIFSELDRTNVKVNYFPWGTRSPQESRRGLPGGPDPPQAWGQMGPRLGPPSFQLLGQLLPEATLDQLLPESHLPKSFILSN